MILFDAPKAAGEPCWYDLSTPDVHRAAAFYGRLFGWTYEASGGELGNYHQALVDGRRAAGIGQPPADNPMPSAWTVHFAAPELDAMVAQATALGAVVMGPMDIPGQGRMAMVQDPAGAWFGLWQPQGHEGFGIAETAGAMAWNEVAAPDADAATAFYTSLLGATSEAMTGAPTDYRMLKHGDRMIGGIIQMDEKWEGVPPHWMPYFQVDDVAATVATTRETGGKVAVEPFEAGPGRLAAVLNDPFGAVFSVVQMSG